MYASRIVDKEGNQATKESLFELFVLLRKKLEYIDHTWLGEVGTALPWTEYSGCGKV